MARRTPLYEAHLQAGGKIVEFAGWELPVQYKGIIEEHTAVRTAVGLFDVSHMGEVFVTGPKALEATQQLLTNDLAKCKDGQALYAGLLNDKGGFVDDVLCYRYNEQKFLLVVNAANAAKDVAWIKAHSFGAQIDDRSDEYAQIAVQGPKSRELVQRLTKVDLSPLGYYRFTEGEVAGGQCIIARTGYTGELGFELYTSSGNAMKLWGALLEAGKDLGVMPAALGARDSLRLEMKFALYGNDIDDEHTPLEADLGWIVKLNKGEFIGRQVLVDQKEKGLGRKLVGFTMTDKGIPRHGYPILKDGKQVGVVTSGTQSPTLKKPIGMGYVPLELSAIDSTFDVEIRGRPAAAVVVKTPFVETSNR
ncbi:MAG TPA: glycine cleavage system aminomethyltransferase GcvT [Myxococcales bacterium]|jgi:aminomethyltransferase|nr:glycine cleavage system aminomethyltransferase GcvT [Myxococcales bacterium]